MLHILSKILIQKVRDDYNSIADSFSETRQKPWKGWDLLKKYFDQKKSVLDIGCGNGRLSNFFKYKTYTGIDISKNLIELAKKEYESKNTHFEVGNFQDLPSSTNKRKFDTIVSIAVFHHLPSTSGRKKALLQVQKALKNDGIFIFSIWNLLHAKKYAKPRKKALLFSILTLGLMHPRDLFIPWKKGSNKRNRYYYSFKEKEVINLLENTGFEVIETIPEANGKKVEIKNALNVYFVCKKK